MKERPIANLIRMIIAGTAIGVGSFYLEKSCQDYPVEDSASIGDLDFKPLPTLEPTLTPTVQATPTSTPQGGLTPAENYDPNFPDLQSEVEPVEPFELTSILYKVESQRPFLETQFGSEKLNAAIEAIQIYWPIYQTAADRFQVPWYLIWIIHGEESTFSKNPAAFDQARAHFGAGQRNRSLHPDWVIERYAAGFEYLAQIPTRHPSDWKEILWMGAKLAEDSQTTGSLQNALARYSPVNAAYYYSLFQFWTAVFAQR